VHAQSISALRAVRLQITSMVMLYRVAAYMAVFLRRQPFQLLAVRGDQYGSLV
jgi:hypothetical protein